MQLQGIRVLDLSQVKNLREGIDDPQVRFREMIIEDAQGNEHIGVPIKFLKEPRRVSFAAPRQR